MLQERTEPVWIDAFDAVLWRASALEISRSRFVNCAYSGFFRFAGLRTSLVQATPP